MELRNFYKFTALQNLPTLKEKTLAEGNRLGIKGTILYGDNGINAAISADTSEKVIYMQKFLEDLLNTQFTPLITNLKETDPDNYQLPFRKFKVKVKDSIVALGVSGVDPACSTGELVKPEHWNKLITDPATITIDTRNIYEYLIGHFKGAVDPHTPNFCDFIDYVNNMNEITEQYKNIAMYCTGGIRCEIASSYMIKMNIKNTYQLHGGILSYFQQVPQEESLWEGACFVFDDRIAVDNDMKPSSIKYEDIPSELHKEKERNRHSGHIYKKIMSITE